MIKIEPSLYPWVFFLTWIVGTAVLSAFVYWTVTMRPSSSAYLKRPVASDEN